MVSKIIQNRIIKLSVDKSSLDKGITDASKKVKSFDDGLKNLKTDHLDKINISAKSVAESISNAGKKVPLIANLSSSMRDVGSAAQNASGGVTDMANGVTDTAGKFGMLANAASYALGGIILSTTQKIFSLMNRWTIAPIVDGFREYERELESTRVLTTALGEDNIDLINDKMRELERYAQTTRYSSQQMNASLSSFVNNGIDIEKATVALKGYGNLAASSAASTQAFNASLEFGIQQALAMGYMDRMNWRSIQNANMATQKFKDTLIEEAKAMGTLDDAMIEAYGKQDLFMTALSETHWLSNDVLLSALEQYSTNEDMIKQAASLYTFSEAVDSTREQVSDSWGKMWVEIAGKGDEASQIWTPVGEAMATIATAIPKTVTKIAAAFNQLEGRQHLIDALKNGIDGIKMVWNGVLDAFSHVFPSKNIFQDIASTIIKWIDTLGSKLKTNERVGRAFGSVFTLIFQSVKLVIGIARQAAKAIEFLIPDNIITNLVIFAGAIADVVLAIQRYVSSFFNFNPPTKLLDAFNSLGSGIGAVFKAIEKVFQGFTDVINKMANNAGKSNKKLKVSFNIFTPIAWVVEQLAKVMSLLADGIVYVANKVSKLKILETAGKWFGTLRDMVVSLGDIMEPVFDGVSKSFGKIQNNISGFVSKLDLGGILGFTVKAEDLGMSEIADENEKSTVKISKNTGSMFKDLTNNFKRYKTQSGGVVATILTMRDAFGGLLKAIKDLVVAGFGKLGEAFETVNSWDIFGKLLTGTKNIITGTIEEFKRFGGLLADIFGIDVPFLTELWQKLVDGVTGTGATMAENWQTVKDIFGEITENINIVTFFEAIGAAFVEFGKILEKIGGPFKGVFDTLMKGFAALGDTLGSGEVWDVTKLVILYSTLEKLDGKDSILEKLAGAFVKLKDGILFWKKDKSLLETVKHMAGTFEKSIKSQTVLNFAWSFGIIAGAMLLLSAIPADKAKQVALLTLEVALIIASVFTIMQVVSNKFSKGSSASTSVNVGLDGLFAQMGFGEMKVMMKRIGLAAMMIGVASAVLLVVKAIGKIVDMPLKKIGKGVGTVGVIMLGLAAAVRLAGKGASMGDALKIAALALGIKMITDTIQKVVDIKYETLNEGLLRVGQIGVVLAGMAALLGGGEVNYGPLSVKVGNPGVGAAATLLALVFSIKMISNEIEDIAAIPKENIDKAMPVIGSIAMTLAKAAALMGLNFEAAGGGGAGINVSTSDQSWPGAATLLALAWAVKDVTGAVMDAAKADDMLKIEAAAGVVKSLAIVLGAMTALMGLDFQFFKLKIKTNKVSLKSSIFILALVFGIKLIVGAIKEISEIDGTALLGGLAVITVIGVVIGGIIFAVGNWSNIGKLEVVGLIITIAGILLIAGEVRKVAEVDGGKLLAAVGVIATIGLVVAGIMGVAGSMQFNPAQVAAMAVALGGLVLALGAFALLAQIPADQLGLTLLAIVGFLVALGLALAGLAVLATGPQGVMLIALLLSIGAAALAIGGGALMAVTALTMLYDLIKQIVTDVASIIGGIIEWFQKGGIDIPGAAKAIWDGVTGAWNAFWGAIGDWGGMIIDFIVKGISGGITAIGNAAAGIWNAITGAWNSFWGGLGDWGGKLVGKIKDGIDGAKNLAKGAADGVANVVKGALDIGSKLFDSGKKIIEKFGEGIQGAFDTVKGWVEDGIGAILDFFPHSPAPEGPLSGRGWTRLSESGEAFAGQFGSGIKSGMNDLTRMVSEGMSTLSGLMNDADVNSTITPVMRPVVDTSGFNTSQLSGLMSRDSAILQFGYDQLNAAAMQFGSQQQSINKLIESMNNVKSAVEVLQNQNEIQTQAIQEGKYINNYMDSTLVNKQLAPGMIRAQENYKRQTNRLGGELPSLT